MSEYHTSILHAEIEAMGVKNGVIVDATLGGGGHSESLFNNLENGKLISIDRDQDAIDFTVKKYGHEKDGENFILKSGSKEWILVKGSFGDLTNILQKLGIADVQMILADVGLSSYQIDTSKRGFSFLTNGPLDMRMDKNIPITAKDLVNGLRQSELAKIFKDYGEERYAEQIAFAITEIRKRSPINTTFDIVEIIKKSVGAKYEFEKNPSRRVFQALRIAVNDELGELSRLCDGIKTITGNPEIVLLTFHSLERKIVEEKFTQFQIIKPTEEEIKRNSRSKSCVAYVVN